MTLDAFHAELITQLDIQFTDKAGQVVLTGKRTAKASRIQSDEEKVTKTNKDCQERIAITGASRNWAASFSSSW